ncbi:hypothetical protein [Hydrogenivirga sp. 128-5-R1-1]|uniref:hypothetical protein n=1 Tax=Hydrogenivirga sp. 128-5-R1-1 TaxID=392423 RepID=UPI00015F36B9|nr:hypothetical protein [Hydrogenivirga sp. 128-5-R1-1]EDP76307.1 hypothetical protein HG1285_01833 [Hydrogenivirga sp. 128-5-R1-1]
MKFDVKELIEDYLLEGGIQDRIEKFELAWDIRDYFEDIKLSIRESILKKLVKKLKEKTKNPGDPFYGYKLEDNGFLEREKYGNIAIYRREWVVNGKPILKYGIEHGLKDYFNLYFGIQKCSDQIPFVGNWENIQGLPEEWKEIFSQMKIRLKEALPGNWKPSDWWVVWKYFDFYYGGMWQKEFYMEILEKSKDNLEEGYEALADYYFSEFEKLKNATENLVDEFVKLYKEAKGGSHV